MVHGKPRLAGTRQRGNSTKESSPLEAPLAQLNEPSGVAADEGELWQQWPLVVKDVKVLCNFLLDYDELDEL